MIKQAYLDDLEEWSMADYFTKERIAFLLMLEDKEGILWDYLRSNKERKNQHTKEPQNAKP